MHVKNLLSHEHRSMSIVERTLVVTVMMVKGTNMLSTPWPITKPRRNHSMYCC